ncbi:uncharacterized protein PITG_21706, partial [Phytophthora infestans T30-4]
IQSLSQVSRPKSPRSAVTQDQADKRLEQEQQKNDGALPEISDPYSETQKTWLDGRRLPRLPYDASLSYKCWPTLLRVPQVSGATHLAQRFLLFSTQTSSQVAVVSDFAAPTILNNFVNLLLYDQNGKKNLPRLSSTRYQRLETRRMRTPPYAAD